jgi:hypothetical protein
VKHLPSAVAIGGLALLALFAIDRSCVADRALEKAKADYAEQVRVLEADNAFKRDAILKAEEVITQQDAQIAVHVANIAAKDARITLLSGQLADIVGQEPPTTPEVESLPIVINLREQVARLSEMFSLALAKSDAQDRVIASWQTKYAAQVEISRSWQGQFENEHVLRLESERLFGMAEHRVKSTKFWRVTAYVAGAVALGAIIAK